MARLQRRGPGCLRLLCSFVVVLLVAHPASAQTTFSVGSDVQLRSAISALSAGDSIVFTGDITLAGHLDPIRIDNVTIDGRGFTLSGDRRYRGLVVGAGSHPVTAYVNNLTIRDAAAIDAGGAPGGVAGRGGGLFIASAASVYVSGLNLISNIATGGASSSPGGGIGGALFIQGGDAHAGLSAGQLIVSGGLTINGSTVGGAAAAGSDAGLVMEGDGTVLFRPSAGQTTTIDDAIVDVDGTTGVAGSGAWRLDHLGAGRIVLRGNNRYTGGTSIDGNGTLNVLTAANLGTGSVTVENGSTLEIAGSGSFSNGLLLDAIGRVSIDAGQTATWNGRLTNEHSDGRSGMLVVAGGGTLVLSDATNDYSLGTAVVDNSTLSVGADGALGRAATAISLGNSQTQGTLGIAGSLTTARPVVIGAAGGGIDVAGNIDAALTGTVGGAGGLTKTGAGSLALAAANSYAGPTSIAAGMLRAGAANAFGTSGTMSIARGATLDLNNFDYTFDTLSGGGDVALGTATLTVESAGNATLNGAITGAGVLVKDASGTFTLGGANRYSGGTIVRGGTLAGTTSSLQGAIANDATVAFVQNTDGTYAGTITGGGALVKSGSGTVALTGPNTYSGGTTVSGGTLAGNTVSLQGNIVDNANVTFDQVEQGTFNGVLSGSGRLTKNGNGALILTGANSYAGGTVVNAGSLVGDARSVQGAIVNNASVTFEQAGDGTYGGRMSGSGRMIKSGTGALTLAGANTYSGGTTVEGGTLIGDAASLQGDIVNQAGVVFDHRGDGTYAGNMTGTGRLTKTGAGVLSLTGINGYTGGTTVSAGTLSGNTASLRGTIVNDASLVFNQATDSVFQGTIGGGGVLTKLGAGTLAMTGTHATNGLVNIQQGVLALNGSLGGSAAVGPGAAFTLNGTVSGDVTVAPGGSFTALGSTGGLNLAGALTIPGVDARASVGGPQPIDASDPTTLTVNGNLETLAGSTLNLEARSRVAAPVQVTGVATIADTHFNVTVNDPSRGRLTSYPLVTTSAVSLTSATATIQTPDRLVPHLISDSRSVRLAVLDLAIPLAAVSTSTNGRAVASVLDTMQSGTQSDTGAIAPFVRNLAGLEDRELDAALAQLPGEVNVTSVKMAVIDSAAITDLVRSEMSGADEATGIDVYAPDQDANPSANARVGRPRWWTELTGQRANLRGRGDLHGATVNVGGVAFGLDLKRSGRFSLGAGLSITAGSLALSGLDEASHIRAPRVFSYSGYRLGRFEWHGGGSAAWTDTTSKRQIRIVAASFPDGAALSSAFDQTAEAERDGTAQDLWTEGQVRFSVGRWTTESKAGWRHSRFAQHAFRESGAGPISLQGGEDTVTLTEYDVLVRTYKRSGRIRPHFLFTYRRGFGNGENSADVQFVDRPDTSFAVTGLPLAKNTVAGLGGVTFRTGLGLEYTTDYQFHVAEYETSHSVHFRIRFR